MKKKLILISIPIILLVVILTCFFLLRNTESKNIDYSIDIIREGLNKFGKKKYKNKGKLSVTAKYKGAHGEHYPAYFNYYYETNIENGVYTVSIGNQEGFVTKQYEIELIEIIEKLKEVNTTKLDYISYKKEDGKNKLDVDIINDALDTNFKACTIDIKSSGILNKFESSTIKCDETLTIELSENKTLIDYYENKIRIDSNETGYSLSINDTLKMNAFYEEDKTRYSIVIDDDVFYVETLDNQLFVSGTSSKAIYNAMEVTVIPDDIVLNKITPIDEKEIPIFRYYNEFNFNYWRDTNE